MSDNRVTAAEKSLAAELMAAAGDENLEQAARKRAYAALVASGESAAADRVLARIRSVEPDVEIPEPAPVEKATRSRSRKAR